MSDNPDSPAGQDVTRRIADGIAWITLNRPDAGNAMTGAMRDQISEWVQDASSDLFVRVVVITAAGDRAFCTGADLRGGRPAPRPAQWFIFGPWLYDIGRATCLLADAPRLARPLPVTAWAYACGLDREPGADPRTIALIGPGPGFDPACALGTDLAQPVIIATLAPAGQRPAPLLIDGIHRLYKAHALGVAELPSWVLTAAETEAIRSPSRPRPARPRAAPGGSP